MTDLPSLLEAPRIKLVAELEPLAGSRFQPTGFPDLGAAIYPDPNDRENQLMLVESAQSMANHLEGVLWPRGASEPVASVAGLPYVRVEREGEYLTSSRTESHRLASAYVKAALYDAGETGLALIQRRLGLAKGSPIDHRRVAREVFDMDPLALVHGVFFADDDWYGQPKLARALTAFIEARGVQAAHSGGVKFDHVSNTGDKDAQRGSKEGFGNVPFPRTEFVATTIEAMFVIDTSQIRRYDLEPMQRELLLALALLEIRGLLDEGLRLRTACDLHVVALRGERPEGFELADRPDLERLVRERIGADRPPLVGAFA